MPGGTGCITGFLQKFFYLIVFLGLTHSTSLKSPNIPSSIIDFPFSLFLGKDFCVEPEGFPCQRKPLASSSQFLVYPKGLRGAVGHQCLKQQEKHKKKRDWLSDPSCVGCGSSLWKYSYLKPSFMTRRTLGVLGMRDVCPSLPLL